MFKITIFLIPFFCAFINAELHYEIVQDLNDGEEYVAILPFPISRQRRQTTLDINKGQAGTNVRLGQQGTIFRNDNHEVLGKGYVSKQFHPSGPLNYGGGVKYEHLPSGSGLSVGASKTNGFGTDFSANANANLWQSKNGNSRLDATGFYQRHYGGPWGTGKPNAGVGLNFNSNF